MGVLLVFLASSNPGDRSRFQLGFSDFRGRPDRCYVVLHFHGKEEELRWSRDRGRGKEGALQMIDGDIGEWLLRSSAKLLPRYRTRAASLLAHCHLLVLRR